MVAISKRNVYLKHHKPTSAIILAIVAIQAMLLTADTPHSVSALYIKERGTELDLELCGKLETCGWEVYQDSSFKQARKPSYFVFAPCRCPENMDCLRDFEVVSINSYVHRCKLSNGTKVMVDNQL